jgi:peptidoglycan/LPS O-acetylase OafA/YrhL
MGSPNRPARPEFRYLDGIRGFAAIAVVLYHALLYSGLSGQSTRELPFIDFVFGWGYLGVPVFIVLSGYVLMLPALSSRDLTLRGGTLAFIKRRARRILPPYYAALALSIVLVLAVPIMQSASGTQWDSKIPVDAGSVLSHLFLVHDFSPDWIGKINGPLWSVAVEWQIYFLMPFLLLPLWRRFRPVVVVIGVVAVTASPIFTGIGEFAHPWLIGLFAIGMWAAQLTFSGTGRRGPLVFLVMSLVVVAVAILATKHFDIRSFGLIEIPFGVGVGAALVWMGRRSVAGTATWSAKLFQSRPLMHLGLFSYTIYLIHSPLLALANLLLVSWDVPLLANWAMMTFVAVPLVLVASWGMFLCVEQRFLNSRQKRSEAELTSERKSERVDPATFVAIDDEMDERKENA